MLELIRRKRERKVYFPNLHSHTGIGSLGDGFGTVDMWMDALEKRKIKHHFVTDHGTLAAIPWMYKEGKKRGIRIHPGMEGYVIPEYDYRLDEDGNRFPIDSKNGKPVRPRFRHIVLIPMTAKTTSQNITKIRIMASIMLIISGLCVLICCLSFCQLFLYPLS